MSEISNNKSAPISLKINETNEEELEEDEFKKINIELREKIAENENYQQELHELRHKLKVCLATQKDLSDANESLDDNLAKQQIASEKKINNLLEKFSVEKKKYEERLSELQTSLSREEEKNEELKEALNTKEKLFAKLKFNDSDKTQETLILKEKVNDLIYDLEEKEKIEKELLFRQQRLEETIATLQKDYNEIRDILEVKKVDLESLNDILETTRDELVMCRSELELLKSAPASDSTKGNSLFAEVEDNRQKLINDFDLMRRKYLQMKQTYEAKEHEIRTLKVERSALLRKWEDDNGKTVDHGARLIETYKLRISELESRLKMEEKKQKTKGANNEQPAEGNFSYLQSLLKAKKKEVEELVNKLEESSTQKILQEEMKYETEKQMRQWKCAAMSYQAQLLVSQNQIKCKECLKMKLKDSGDADLATDTKQLSRESTKNTTSNLSGMSNPDSIIKRLLQDKKVSKKEGENIIKCSTVVGLSVGGESVGSLPVINLEESIYMDETIPISSLPNSPMKLISNQESNKENSASTSNMNDTLKSALVKSEDKSLCLNIQEKTKKSLRFTSDTMDPQKPKLTRQKMEKKTYPVVFISNQSSK